MAKERKFSQELWRGVFSVAALALACGLLLGQDSLQQVQTQHIEVIYPAGRLHRATAEAYAGAVERMLFDAAHKMSLSKPLPKVTFTLFASAEEEYASAGRDDVAVIDAAHNKIEILFIPPFTHFDPAIVGRFLLEKEFGPGRNPVLEEGFAEYLMAAGGALSLDREGKRLSSILQVEGALDLSSLLLPEVPHTFSPFVIEPLALEFVRFLASRYGVAKLVAVYKRELSPQTARDDVQQALGISWDQLASEWKAHCARREQTLMARFGVARQLARRRATDGFQKGMSFSAEGRAHASYLSQAALQSLDEIVKLHINWISVMPFAFPSRPDRRELVFAMPRSWESDDAIRRIACEARLRGLQVFLKPHLWLGRLPTSNLQVSAADWPRWFASYRRYILHHARLAQEIGASMFAIGNELPHLTLDPAHERDWRKLIADVRKVYAGEVTYCASWGPDFENVRFADALDVMGLNDYYPLATNAAASLEQLRKGARRVAKTAGRVAARIKRPIILTEVGFPDVPTAVVKPWKEDATGVSDKVQTEAIRAVLEAFWGKPWLRGMYWWKWNSHRRSWDTSRGDFGLEGTPAMRLISGWYARPY